MPPLRVSQIAKCHGCCGARVFERAVVVLPDVMKSGVATARCEVYLGCGPTADVHDGFKKMTEEECSAPERGGNDCEYAQQRMNDIDYIDVVLLI